MSTGPANETGLPASDTFWYRRRCMLKKRGPWWCRRMAIHCHCFEGRAVGVALRAQVGVGAPGAVRESRSGSRYLRRGARSELGNGFAGRKGPCLFAKQYRRFRDHVHGCVPSEKHSFRVARADYRRPLRARSVSNFTAKLAAIFCGTASGCACCIQSWNAAGESVSWSTRTVVQNGHRSQSSSPLLSPLWISSYPAAVDAKSHTGGPLRRRHFRDGRPAELD